MLLFILLSLPLFSSSPIVSCYYRYNDPPVQNVPGHICTHIILIGNTFLDHLGHFQQPNDVIAKEFMSIKKKFPNVKLLLCETGENTDFSTLVSSEETMQRFAKESASYLRKWSMDGLDLDWEFPTWSWDAKKSDKYRFTSLLKILREEYGSDLLLTAAVSGPPTITRKAYEIHEFNRYLDLVHVMNYDFHVYNFLTNPVVGFNAPLRRMRGEEGPIGEMNSEASMATYRQLGLWENKTLFGIPTYNLAFKLVNYWLHKPFAPAEGSVDGFGDRSTICKILEDHHTYMYVWNERAASPYIWGKDKVWISMEDEKSVSRKAAYAMQLGVAGVMIFHIGSDDVHGSCGNGEYPLLNAISKEVHTKSNKV